MKQVLTIAFTAFLIGAGGLAGFAQAIDVPDAVAEAVADGQPEIVTGPLGLPIFDATDVTLADFIWTNRLIVVFAETPNDPAFARQIEFILEREQEMIDRDVVLITDSDPAARSDARIQLRPRAFMLAIVGKDGEVKSRRPSSRKGREIMQTIDSFPLRRQEMLEQNPSGRP
jgi:hypothetical protein